MNSLCFTYNTNISNITYFGEKKASFHSHYLVAMSIYLVFLSVFLHCCKSVNPT